MAEKSRNYDQELASIMNAMAESTLEMTDEEIESEIREEGADLDAVAKGVRDVLRRAIKASQQRLLQEAQTRYEERVAGLEVKKYQMPHLHDEQRKMITTILAGNPQLRAGLLTAQFRDLQNLPDEEVESYLRQLLELIEMNDLADSTEGKE
jgi:hypothetical protein